MNKKNFFNWFATILLGVCSVLFVWTFALSVPIYYRFVYYVKVNEISSESGYDKKVVREAYDDVLDYLTLHKEFRTGDLLCSDEAKEHFADCQKLFDLNLGILVASAAVLLLLSVLCTKKIIEFKRIGKFGVLFYSALVAVAVPLVFGVVATVNFDAAFVLFHRILFPGKTNWQFDPVADEIINILPESYFATCGAIVAGIILAIVVGILMWEIFELKKRNKQKLDK